MIEQNWKYTHIRIPLGCNAKQIDETLNAFGAQGWELVCVNEVSIGWFAFFKKPRETEHV